MPRSARAAPANSSSSTDGRDALRTRHRSADRPAGAWRAERQRRHGDAETADALSTAIPGRRRRAGRPLLPESHADVLALVTLDDETARHSRVRPLCRRTSWRSDMTLTPEHRAIGRRNFMKAIAGTPALAALGADSRCRARCAADPSASASSASAARAARCWPRRSGRSARSWRWPTSTRRRCRRPTRCWRSGSRGARRTTSSSGNARE